MYVVIFRAKVNNLDANYSKIANRMRDLALSEFGCIEFNAVSDGCNEIAVSYWPNEQSMQAWKMHPEHLQAQQQGRELWYESYSVEVANIVYQYRS